MATNDITEVKLLTSGGNWLRIGSMISLGLTGYHEPLGPGVTVSVHAMNTGISCIKGMDMIDRGLYHFGMTSPPWFAKAAAEGKGTFGWTPRPLKLSAVASFPHHDQLVLALRKDLGIKSLHEIRERQLPLRLSSGPLHLEHPLGWVLDAVLAEYGISTNDFERWGGRIGAADRQLNVLAEGPSDRRDRVTDMISGELDGVFDEGIMSVTWKKIADKVDLEYLPIEDDIMHALETKYGAQRAMIPTNRLRGVDADIPSVDFADWLLYCHSDLPDEMVYLALVAVEEQKAQIESMFAPQAPFQGLSDIPFDMGSLCQNTGLPLHPGAKRFYKERGYL